MNPLRWIRFFPIWLFGAAQNTSNTSVHQGAVMSSKLTYFVLVLCGLILLPPVALAGEPGNSSTVLLPEDFADYIVWDRDDPSKAVFRPESALASRPGDSYLEAILQSPDGNFVEPSEFSAFRDKAFQDPAQYCSVSSAAVSSAYTQPSDVDLATWLKNREAAVIATGDVVSVVAGWSSREVRTMVYVRVKEILSCNATRAREIQAGDIVAVALRKGALLVEGRFLCNATDLALTVPNQGDQVLVMGHPAKEFDYYLGTGTVHQIKDGLVQPQPIEGVSPREPLPLNVISEALESYGSECGG